MQPQNPHLRSLETSTAITRYYLPQAIAPLDVIAVLNNSCINCVLVGTHALGGWMRKPRATVDTDIIIAFRHHEKAVNALLREFPSLEAVRRVDVTVLRDRETQDGNINLIRPKQPVFRVASEHTHRVDADGYSYKIPTLEMAIVMKWVSMRAPDREYPDRYQDAHDFLRMIAANDYIDLKKLEEVGHLDYLSCGQQVVQDVWRIQAGEKLNV